MTTSGDRASIGRLSILVDARSLQDPNYRFRGVGQHSASLLSAMRAHAWSGTRPKFIALTDPTAAPLDRAHLGLFDQVLTSPTRPRTGDAWYVSLSPMTHDPSWAANLLQDDEVFKVALFYDLIPLDIPERYLADAGVRTDYLSCLAWLRRYDVFAAISKFSGDGLAQQAGTAAEKIYVSGVAVRRSLEPPPGVVPLPRADRRHIVFAGGGDPRKNPESAIRAHARSRAGKTGFPLQVVGNYEPSTRDHLRRLYAEEGGRATQLVFKDHLTDEALRELYREALLTIVASRAEGFSIPIVESGAAGTPALVSDVGAHPELVGDPAARFDPDDHDRLAGMIDHLIADEPAWERIRAAQADTWRGYTTERVGERFMTGLLARAPTRVKAPAVSRKARPTIGFLTPLPPAASGVASYSAYTLEVLARHADVHVFTPSLAPSPVKGVKSIAGMEHAEYAHRALDGMISVIGNSDHHLEIVDHLLQHGGAAIAHDARMINFYTLLHGPKRALEVARRELGRDVDSKTLMGWLHDQRTLPVLFLSEIARAASPLFVHSRITADVISELYGAKPVLLPFALSNGIDLRRAEKAQREAARRRLGWSSDDIVLATFGIVSADKAPEVLIWAMKMLDDWGVRVRVSFCGAAQPGTGMRERIEALAAELDLEDRILIASDNVPRDEFVDQLFACDIGVQLRTYNMGALSGAVNDCIAAALPSVVSANLGQAMDAPSFIRSIPDELSPVLLAEAVLEILSSGQHLDRPIAQAEAAAKARSTDVYARQLLNGMGFDIPASKSPPRS